MNQTKKMQRFAALFCAALCALSAVGCGDEDATGGSTYASVSDVEFWGTYSTEKILQDNVELYNGKLYEDIKKEAKLSVTAIGGEEEAAQIIMTAGEKAVKEYDVLLSDLQGDNGESFPKEQIKVYHERYIKLGAAAEYYTTAGYYPDCLVPFERVKKVGETGFNAKNNQGLYVSFDVPETQKAGTYTGNMQIVIGGESKSIPVTLRVVAGSIGEETHVKSSFLNEWYFYRGELDTTEEMFEAYNQTLFDYRLGCNKVTVYTKDLDYYAETVCRYAKQANCPSYNIPWSSKNYEGSGYVLNGRELSFSNSYDVEHMQKMFKTIAYKGLEENVDPFKKAFIYGWDEPDLTFGVERAKQGVKEWGYIVKQCKKIVSESLRADDSIENQELLAQMLQSLEKLPHLILSSTFLGEELIDLEQEDVVYGPEFQFVQNKGSQDMYRLSEDNDLWWYGCVNPDYPYPTYHIDDTVLSARLESWMKADYNIQGNLYWSTTLYSEPKASDGSVVYPEDFYSGNAARTLGTNGEGFLFYPGKKYGLSTPLPSLRLEQIRDGLEEYEILYKLANIYGSVGSGYTEDQIMKYLYEDMYSGTMVNTTSAIFEKNRARLLNLFELACSKAQVCITDVTEGAGAYTFKVYANDGYTVKQKGVEVTQKTAVTGGALYTLNVNISAGESLDLSVEVDGKTYGFAMSFGSSAVNYDGQYAFDNNVIQQRYGSVKTELVTAQSVIGDSAAANEKWVKIALGAAEKAKQDFLLVDDKVIKKLSAEANKAVIRLYNSSADTLAVTMLMEYGNSLDVYAQYRNIDLKPGLNVISVNNIQGMKWHELLYVNKIRFTVGEKGDAARDCLYFVDMAVYK